MTVDKPNRLVCNCIVDVFCSNLGWNTRFPDLCFRGYPQTLLANVNIVFGICQDRFLANHLYKKYIIKLTFKRVTNQEF